MTNFITKELPSPEGRCIKYHISDICIIYLNISTALPPLFHTMNITKIICIN